MKKKGVQVNLYNNIKEKMIQFFNQRIFILIIALLVLFSMLIGQCFNLQIVQGETFLAENTMLIQKTRDVLGTRGNIYDRNGKLIAYNELAYSITIEDNGDYDKKSEKDEAINAVITELIDIVEENGDAIISDFGITLDENGEYAFVAPEGTSRLRFIADVFGQAKIENLTDEQRNISASNMMQYLCTDKQYGFGINQNTISKADVLKYVNVRYAMSLNSYRKYIPTIVAKDINETTFATIMECMNELQGVNVAEETMRRYTTPEYFAPIIGYTGAISGEEYEAYLEEGLTTYSKTDIVGKSGLEQIYDTELQGAKGEMKLYTDNVGNVLDSIITQEAKPGNDLYLTLDSELMEVTYHVIEQELAAILYTKLRNVLEYNPGTNSDATDIILPIGDVYNAFFANMILDVDHFGKSEAGENEAEILNSFNDSFTVTTERILSYLQGPDGVAVKELSDADREYVLYIINQILRNNAKIILGADIDTQHETYKSWNNDEAINAYQYIEFLISQNNIDTTQLQKYMPGESNYSDSSEIFDAIFNYIEEILPYNSGYEKLIYEQMVRTGEITGTQICLAAYEQGVFTDDENENYQERLASGTIGAYDFLAEMIRTIQITPGALGLEPCSASAVVTDPNSGDVLALVSYPGYDTNRLANTMDVKYYNKLNRDLSSPFYNHATMEKTAPGSLFKMVSSAAGLTENVVTLDTIVNCDGEFNKVVPNPKCWIYPKSHGNLNITQALEHSCNGYYYELGYRLSLTDPTLIGTDNSEGNTTFEVYSSNKGTDTLAKYASMFGLNTKSGIEIPESKPQISDIASVPSVIGQGTHNFTTTQLVRYTAAVANKGTVYDLTLVDKLTNKNGELIEEYTNEVSNEITELSSSTWTSIHQGMKGVVENSSVFRSMDDSITMAGKTGTAQQSKTTPDHALFAGFAPVENPNMSLCVRIVNGYQSSYASEIARDITQYYLGVVEKNDIITGEASILETVTAGD